MIQWIINDEITYDLLHQTSYYCICHPCKLCKISELSNDCVFELCTNREVRSLCDTGENCCYSRCILRSSDLLQELYTRWFFQRLIDMFRQRCRRCCNGGIRLTLLEGELSGVRMLLSKEIPCLSSPSLENIWNVIQRFKGIIPCNGFEIFFIYSRGSKRPFLRRGSSELYLMFHRILLAQNFQSFCSLMNGIKLNRLSI